MTRNQQAASVFRNGSRGYLWGVLGFNLLSLVLCVAIFVSTRHSAELEAEARTANLVSLVGQDVQSHYDAIDVVLSALSGIADNRDDTAMRRMELITHLKRRLPEFPALGFTDAQGEVIGGYLSDPGSPLNFADRDFFKRHRQSGNQAMSIMSSPIDRSKGESLLIFSRRLDLPGAGFAGVAFAAFRLDHLESSLAELSLPPDSEIVILDPDRALLAANRTSDALATGGAYRLDALEQALKDKMDRGFIRGRGSNLAPGIDRMYSFARNKDHSFYVLAGLSADQVFQGHRRIVAILVFFELGVIVLSGFFLMRLRSAETARHLAVHELGRSLAIFDAAGKVARFGAWSLELPERTLTWSDETYRLHDLDANEPVDLARATGFLVYDSAHTFSEAIRGAIERGTPFDIEVDLRTAKERAVRARVLGSADREAGRIVRIGGAIMDVTESKAAERRIRESEARFRTFVESTLVGVAVISPSRRVQLVNPALCDMLGYSEDELKSIDWVEVIHPDDRSLDAPQFRRLLAGELQSYEVSKRLIRKDRRVRYALATVCAARKEDGSIDFIAFSVQDVTSLKDAEEAANRLADRVAETLELLDAAGRVAHVGGWSMDVSTRQLRWTAETYRIHEIDPDVAMTLDKALEAYAPPVRAAMARAFERAVADGTPWDFEEPLTTARGRTIWTRFVGHAEHAADGTARLYGAYIDVSERKLAEKELVRQRELLSRFLDHLPASAYVKDAESRVLIANRGFKSQFGVDPETMIGRRSDEIFPGALGTKIVEDDRRVIDQGRTEVIEETFGGRIFESTKFVIDAGHEKLIGGITQDVTERNRQRLRAQYLQALAAYDLGDDEKAFLRFGLEQAEALSGSAIGFLHFVNDDQETIELVTWTQGALRGCTAAYDNHYPISRAGIWADCFREKRAVVFNDYAGHAAKAGLPPGHAPLHRLISVPVIEDGQVRMMMGVGNKAIDYDAFDVESLQMIGNDLWRIARRHRVEVALAARVRELGALNERLAQAQNQLLQSEKMSSIGQLAAGVAHELNNPIGFIQSNLGTLEGYVQDMIDLLDAGEECAEACATSAKAVALRKLRDERDIDFIKDDVKQLVAESREGADRVRRIVQNLKDFSHVSEEEWVYADLHKGLDSTINLCWNEIKYKAELVKAYGELPEVYCVASQINQVFMNILVNAAQAIEARGTITISTGVTPGPDGRPATAWVDVADTGKGIAPEHLQRIFDPFFTTKPVGKGTGLGLSLAWSIVEKHHGQLDVSSKVGEGTRFRISLPLVQAPTETDKT
jgi:PAS domain S-box-containing protein